MFSDFFFSFCFNPFLFCSRTCRYFPGLHLLWSGPLTLILASLLLWQGAFHAICCYNSTHCCANTLVEIFNMRICAQSLARPFSQGLPRRLPFRCRVSRCSGGSVRRQRFARIPACVFPRNALFQHKYCEGHQRRKLVPLHDTRISIISEAIENIKVGTASSTRPRASSFETRPSSLLAG